ncbi:hypothetical protein [Streptomyces sp. NBC_00582]|uniref:hypothetical protein n=1 Tax=Streptomyces sp. NBC_00582 TaxID=2975783 RepID=UPI002E8212F1|nr:hypothetical protein [Streptomyces sp. NBC_00582]WUB64642.1 hypothetical protein OG852_31690 [Streptomyces sp. NBC_00582]
MPWFVVDDNAHSHPKLIAAGNAALGLWLRAGSYAAQHLTDGIVPGVVAKMYGSKPQIAKLLAVGLWHEAGHTCPHPKCKQPAPGDYYMHDYLAPYNPSRAEVTEKRERAAEKKRSYRERQTGPQSGRSGRPAPAEDAPPPRRPSRPAGGPIPEDWQPTDEDVQAAQLARADAGLQQLTPQQIAVVTRKFVRRQLDDQVQAAAWGGRWQQWAENERTEQQPAPGGVVVQFGAMSKSQQQRAGLDRLRDRMSGGTAS